MTDCPPRLRGDLSKWLCELDTGVYVGNVSGRVRDALWQRICENLKTGRATMVYSTNNEQRMAFRTHNTTWTPVDLDGIHLMRRPLPQAEQSGVTLRPGFSKLAGYQMAQRRQAAGQPGAFVIIDLETNGLQAAADAILEFGAIRVQPDGAQQEFSCLVQVDAVAGPAEALTGLNAALLQQQGLPPQQALQQFLDFLGSDLLVGYNIAFDMAFVRAACRQQGRRAPANRCIDLLSLARRKVSGVANYKLETLAAHFSFPPQQHRALPDCRLLCELYHKLK